MGSAFAPIKVDFHHLEIPLNKSELRKYGSPHHKVNEVGDYFRNKLKDGDYDTQSNLELEFSREQILCANEAYPECAVGDPLVDLEVWDEWQNGERAFPYVGAFHPLGIERQDAKAESPAAIGAIGEIFAGLFTQSGISPWVVVRPIRKWPDLICATKDDRFAFIESKGFLCKDGRERIGEVRLPSTKEFNKCCKDAVNQLNADPAVKVWLSFTGLISVDPFHFSVCFISLDRPIEERSAATSDTVPEAVKQGLVDRVVSESCAAYEFRCQSVVAPVQSNVFADDEDDTRALERAKQKVWEEEAEKLPRRVRKVVSGVVANSFSSRDLNEELLGFAKKRLKRIKRASNPSSLSGKRLAEAKKLASSGELAFLRETSCGSLCITDLPRETRRSIELKFQVGSWGNATESILQQQGLELYRCGGVAVGISRKVDGESSPIGQPFESLILGDN